MKRFVAAVVACAFALTLVSSLWAAEPAPATAAPTENSTFSTLATAVTAVTGIAISPLLGTGAYGAYKYFSAEEAEKANLPWFAKPSFFLLALGIVGVCAAKDALGAAVPPGLKKPLDVLETVENKMSGLVAAGAVIPITMNSLSSLLLTGDKAAELASSTGFAMLGAIDFTWLLNLLTVPFGIAVFVMVWMASHAINVLILLSPWGAVDAVLKGARASVMGLLTLSAQLDPKIAAVLSLVVIVIAYLVSGWAFRLTWFGSLFCWDFLTRRKSRFALDPKENKLFSSGGLYGVPVRTYGRLITEPENGRLFFAYKPWLVMPEQKVEVTLTSPHVGRGLFFSSVRDTNGTVFLLPPRYRTHEEKFARLYQLEGGVQEAGLLKAWGALRELFSGTATSTQAS